MWLLDYLLEWASTDVTAVAQPATLPREPSGSAAGAPEAVSGQLPVRPSVVTKIAVQVPATCSDHPRRSIVRVTRNQEGLVVEVRCVSHAGKSLCPIDQRRLHRIMSANQKAGVPHSLAFTAGWGSVFGVGGIDTLEQCFEEAGFVVERKSAQSVFPPASWMRR